MSSSSSASMCVTCRSEDCKEVHDVNAMTQSYALELLAESPDDLPVPRSVLDLRFGPKSGKTVAIKNFIEHLANQLTCSYKIAIRFHSLGALWIFRSFLPNVKCNTADYLNGLHLRLMTSLDNTNVDDYSLVIHDDTVPEIDDFTTRANELFIYTPLGHSSVSSSHSKRKLEEDKKADSLTSSYSVWRIRTKDDDERYINEYHSNRKDAEHALCKWILEDLELNEWSHDEVKDVAKYFEFSASNGSLMNVAEKYKKDLKVMKEIAAKLLTDEEYYIDKITINETKRRRKPADDKIKIRQQLESRLDELENKAIQLKAEIAELRTIKDKQVLDKYDIEHE